MYYNYSPPPGTLLKLHIALVHMYCSSVWDPLPSSCAQHKSSWAAPAPLPVWGYVFISGSWTTFLQSPTPIISIRQSQAKLLQYFSHDLVLPAPIPLVNSIPHCHRPPSSCPIALWNSLSPVIKLSTSLASLSDLLINLTFIFISINQLRTTYLSIYST